MFSRVLNDFGMTSEEFATRLLNEEKVAVVPGTAFGDCGEGFLRVSYAYSLEELKRGAGPAGTLCRADWTEMSRESLC